MESTALLARFKEDILSKDQRYSKARTAALHSSVRGQLVCRADLIPVVNGMITEFSESEEVDDMKFLEGLLALREWILIHCEIPHERIGRRGQAGVTPVLERSLEEYVASETMTISDLEMLIFSGTLRRAAEIYRGIAAKGIPPKMDFVLRRYLGLPIMGSLRQYQKITNEEYLSILAGVVKLLPEDAL